MTGDGHADILLTSRQRTSTTALLTDAAVRRGMDVRPLGGDLHELEELAGSRPVHWYGGSLAADRIAGRLGLGLLEPPDDWLVRLPAEFSGRRIELTTLSEAWSARTPVFVKPPSDKSFPAAVYADGSRLPRSGEGVGPDTSVLVSEVVTFTVEYRLFLLDRRIVTASRYAVHGRLDTAPLHRDGHEREVRAFTERLLAATGEDLPGAVSVDVGFLPDPETGRESWAAVEANMPWFANSYAADPDHVLDVILGATGPLHQFSDADRPFLRPAPMHDREST
ncbi:ATP-grasp domain-containing protein [Streptomyces sp. NBC_01190]|uniref:ATP-grasp domain-containing protein n=1 Tax=Streptomyces sp. NBC_01190 TaxID=2903767 RepID=UPI0038675755|nr:ATP-grasp domain-containing protein [Streptomyces sp. NBC_01190]